MSYEVKIKFSDCVKVGDEYTRVTTENKLNYNEWDEVDSLIGMLVAGCGKAEVEIKEVKDGKETA